jgi:CBS-domain-containing membrane protein
MKIETQLKESLHVYELRPRKDHRGVVPHPPAAATTLIVSLGVVSRPAYLVVLEAAVGLLVVQAIIINRLTGVRYPFWASVPAPKIGDLASRGALQRFTRFLWLG